MDSQGLHFTDKVVPHYVSTQRYKWPGSTGPRDLELVQPTARLFEQTTLKETSMEEEGTVLFSVNPPSPIESEYCSDDQESVLKSWRTGPLTGEPPNGNFFESATPCSSSVDTKSPRRPSPSDSTRALAAKPDEPFRTGHRQGVSERSNKGDPSSGRKSLASRRSSGTGGDPTRKSELYKTELCISVNSGMPCKYGDQCQFAHSVQELNHVNRHPRYKTQLCTSYQSQGYCKYNDRCTFVHDLDEARAPIQLRRASAAENVRSPLGSGSTTPLQDPKVERLRAMSDSCVQYPDSAPFPRKTASSPVSLDPRSTVGTDVSSGLVCRMTPRRRHGPTISFSPQSIYALETTSPTGPGALSQQLPLPCHPLTIPSLTTDACDLTLQARKMHSFRSESPVLEAKPAPEQPEVDVEWASKLARYIWTPQNDF